MTAIMAKFPKDALRKWFWQWCDDYHLLAKQKFKISVRPSSTKKSILGRIIVVTFYTRVCYAQYWCCHHQADDVTRESWSCCQYLHWPRMFRARCHVQCTSRLTSSVAYLAMWMPAAFVLMQFAQPLSLENQRYKGSPHKVSNRHLTSVN